MITLSKVLSVLTVIKQWKWIVSLLPTGSGVIPALTSLAASAIVLTANVLKTVLDSLAAVFASTATALALVLFTAVGAYVGSAHVKATVVVEQSRVITSLATENKKLKTRGALRPSSPVSDRCLTWPLCWE